MNNESLKRATQLAQTIQNLTNKLGQVKRAEYLAALAEGYYKNSEIKLSNTTLAACKALVRVELQAQLDEATEEFNNI